MRAMQPWPTAYTYLHRQTQAPVRVIVSRAKVCEVDFDFDPALIPGGLLVRSPSSTFPALLLVRTAAHAVEVIELQPAGKKRMSAVDFLRGHPLKEGDRFGPETA